MSETHKHEHSHQHQHDICTCTRTNIRTAEPSIRTSIPMSIVTIMNTSTAATPQSTLYEHTGEHEAHEHTHPARELEPHDHSH